MIEAAPWVIILGIFMAWFLLYWWRNHDKDLPEATQKLSEKEAAAKLYDNEKRTITPLGSVNADGSGYKKSSDKG